MTEESGAILVVDDDVVVRRRICDALQARGYHCAAVGSGREALDRLAEHDYAVALIDDRMQDEQGAELATTVARAHPEVGVILMTARGTVEIAVEAMRGDAGDVLVKPLKPDDLVRVVERVLRETALHREVGRLHRDVRKEYGFHRIIGTSKPMLALFDLVRRVADGPTNVLISGDSGTGKELVAKAIHYNSARRSAPFLAVNCAAIPEPLLESELFGHMRGAFTDAKADKRGLFEEAHKGTLLLDEVSELPLLLQAKLLRAIQEREIRRIGAVKPIAVDVRIIAATNLNLADEVTHKRFREDVYYRLNVIEVHLPPLCERREDIPLLAEAFLKACALVRGRQAKRFSDGAMAMLVDYAWPGNVRELENVVERAVTLSLDDVITAQELPLHVQGARGDRRIVDDAVERAWSLQDVEREYIVRIMEKTGGNKYQAAQILGIDRKTLYRKLAEIETKLVHPAQRRIVRSTS